MKVILAILLPPLAVLLCGKPVQAVINFFLTLLFWIPGVIHALYVVQNFANDQRTDRIVRAVGHAAASQAAPVIYDQRPIVINRMPPEGTPPPHK